MARILIPDYQGQQVRAGIRSLSRNGDICDLAWGSSRIKSVYVSDFHRITPSKVDDERYVHDIVSLCNSQKYDLIMPFGNKSYYALARHGDILRANGIACMVPDYETFSIAHDKGKTIELCNRVGIKTPEVYSDYADDDIKAIARNVRYPVVIKARRGQGVFSGLRYANNSQELIRCYNEISSTNARTGAESYDSPLIQEFVPGYIHDACTLTDQGRVITVLTQRRHVMFPIYGGVGAVNVTTQDKRLAALARNLLEELEWHGPAQIEFKYDERDHEYKLIEINPKFWGTLDLSIKAGVDFPGMVRDILLNRHVETDRPYQAGLRYIFLFPQAVVAYAQLIKEFGLRQIFDQQKYKKTCFDIDPKDLIYDLSRAYRTARSICSGRYRTPNNNISHEFINRINQ